MSALIQTEGLVGGYSAAERIVKGVSMRAEAGELVTIIGPNGAGKSTALKLISGLLRPLEGVVRIDGQDVTGHAPQEIARAGLGFVPQERNVFGVLSVQENLQMGCLFDKAATAARMEAAFGRFPMLAEKRRISARSLSGGQRQRIALARALARRPKLLILDEPSNHLDSSAIEQLVKNLQTWRKQMSILIISHHKELLTLSHKTYQLVNHTVSLCN